MTYLRGALALLTLTGCAAVGQAAADLGADFGPGVAVTVLHDPGDVTPQLSQRWGCSHQGVVELAEKLEEEAARVPTVGMNACVVLASFGAPYSVDRPESEGGVATWWHKDGGGMHYVSFEYVEDLAAYYEQRWANLGQCRDAVVEAHKENIIDKDLDSHWIVDYLIWEVSQEKDAI